MHGLFIDNFCGGGGASTGIAAAIGRDVDIAVNHDQCAIAIHKANHPTAEHHCNDIRAVWPLMATRGRKVDGMWASPDCKEFSKAKGGPVKDRSIRTLADEIPHWLRETQPDVCYVENVEEFEDWGPLEQGDDGKWRVILDRKGEDFKKWVRRCRAAGYRVEWRQLRACDYGAPTSRKRLYIVMRRDKAKVVWPKPTHAPANDNRVLAGKLKPYRTAAECIDWSIPCPSIFLTKEDVKAQKLRIKRPLEEATLFRVAHGTMRYVVEAARRAAEGKGPRPFMVPLTHRQDAPRVHDGAEPFRTITGANRGEIAAADVTLAPKGGFVFDRAYTNTRAARVFEAEDLLRSQTTQESFGVAEVELAPHITKFHSGSVGSGMDKEMPAVTANGESKRPGGATPLGMVGASLVKMGNGEREGQAPRALDPKNPLGTTTATGSNFAAVGATLIGVGGRRAQSPPMPLDGTAPTTTTKADGAIAEVKLAHLEKFNADSRPNTPNEPLRTVIAGAAMHAVVETSVAPLIVETAHGAIDKAGKRRGRGHRSVQETAPTQTTSNNSALVSTFLSRFHASNTNGGSGQTGAPLGAVTAGGQHHSVVCAHMEQANTGCTGHDVRKPLSTIVGKGSTQQIVETTMIEKDALPPAMMERATQVAAFLIKYYGAGLGQTVDKPIDTVTTLDRFAVVTVTIDAVTYVIVDIGLRMLTPRELARAQGFPDSYVLDPVVPKIKRGKLVHEPLTKAEQIRMIGNSVCPDVARALVAANQPGAIADWEGTVSEWKLAA